MYLGMKRTDDLFDVHELSLFPQARLASKLKMLEIDKFDGTRCPITHLKMSIRAL